MIKIVYTDYFAEFLKQFDINKQEAIKKIIIDYCDHRKLLPRPKSSSLRKNIKKVALSEVNVVIVYVDLDDSWLILTGFEMFERVA